MNTVKSLIPDEIKRMIANSTPDNLTITADAILDFLRPLPQFRKVIGELTDPELALCRKSVEVALDAKKEGNEWFKKGDYAKALVLYSKALRHVPTSSGSMDANLVATLYVNRASTLHAWFRRGKAYASLKRFQIAKLDLEVALNIEETLSGKRHIDEELHMIDSELKTGDATVMSMVDEEEKVDVSDTSSSTVLQCVSTPCKGRGMASINDIPPSVLLHSEQPLAAILLKSCRESHCHFCFEELPKDVLFCHSCTIPVYCSELCLKHSGGENVVRCQVNDSLKKKLSHWLQKHIMDAVSAKDTRSSRKDVIADQIPEHQHECGGFHWSAVLPSDVVLAGRIMASCIGKSEVSSSSTRTLGLCHNYIQNSTESKLEMHAYAVVLLFCLYQSLNFNATIDADSVAQLILLLSQIKVNSMAVVHMKSAETYEAFKEPSTFSGVENYLIASMEQVRVAQAVYLAGSMFNHSCQPNTHAYFLSRTLFIRSTELVPAGCPLELSYGPQVGELCLKDRQKLLEEQYSFRCCCSGCSELNLPDVVIDAFKCAKPYCLGAVTSDVYWERLGDNILQVSGGGYCFNLSIPMSENGKDLNNVVNLLVHEKGTELKIAPGRCLSCSSFHDPEKLNSLSRNSVEKFRRLKDALLKSEDQEDFVSDLINNFNCLKSVRHPYSKALAQVEDIMSEAFANIGKLEMATRHCNESIKILKKLYGNEHIVIGHELMKLASIQLSSSDYNAALKSLSKAKAIFSVYFGSHVRQVIPYFEAMKNAADSIVSANRDL